MRAGVIIYNPNIQSILLIHRIKADRDYYVIPGGRRENLETPLQAAQREISEELGWNLPEQDLTFAFKLSNQGREEHYFLYQTTQIKFPTIQGEEKERSSADNRYLPTWVKLDQLSRINLQPQKLLHQILSLDLKLVGF